MMEPMICETFLQFRYLSDLGLSPDGRYTAYIRQQANLASNGYDARLWVYDHSTGADRPLSSLSPVRAFSWMDNRTILFSGMRGTAGSASQDTTTYYALPVDGGEAQPLFTVPMRAGRARRLTDGRFVFTATVDIQNSGILLFVDNKCNIFCLLPNHRPCDGIRRIVQLLRCRIYLFTRLLTDCFRRRICSGNCCL